MSVPTFLQSKAYSTNTAATSHAITLDKLVRSPCGPIGPSTLVITLSYDGTSGDQCSGINDTAGNTWQKGTSATNGATTNGEMWYAYNVKGGNAPTITVSMSSSVKMTMEVVEVDQIRPVSPLDQALSRIDTTNSSARTSAASNSTKRTGMLEVVVGGIAWSHVSLTCSNGGSGFSGTLVTAKDGSSGIGVGMVRRIADLANITGSNSIGRFTMSASGTTPAAVMSLTFFRDGVVTSTAEDGWINDIEGSAGIGATDTSGTLFTSSTSAPFGMTGGSEKDQCYSFFPDFSANILSGCTIGSTFTFNYSSQGGYDDGTGYMNAFLYTYKAGELGSTLDSADEFPAGLVHYGLGVDGVNPGIRTATLDTALSYNPSGVTATRMVMEGDTGSGFSGTWIQINFYEGSAPAYLQLSLNYPIMEPAWGTQRPDIERIVSTKKKGVHPSALSAYFAPTTIPVAPSAPSLSSWYVPLSEPRRSKKLVTRSEIVEPVRQPVPRLDSWFEQASEPRRIRRLIPQSDIVQRIPQPSTSLLIAGTPLFVDEIITDVGSSTYTGSKTYSKIGATSPGALTIQFVCGFGSSTVAPTSVTYGGVPISLSSINLWPGAGASFTCYYGSLINPPSGAQNLVINFPGNAFIVMLATFWGGTASSVNWNIRGGAAASPVVNIAKASSSALASFVVNQQPPTQLNTFLGAGTERFINPAGTDIYYAATQEPSQGTGSIDWIYYDPREDISMSLITAHVTAEILGGGGAVGLKVTKFNPTAVVNNNVWSSIPTASLNTTLYPPSSVVTTSEVVDVGPSPPLGGSSSGSGRYGKHLPGSLLFVPKEEKQPESHSCAIPTYVGHLRPYPPQAVTTAHHRSTVMSLAAVIQTNTVASVIGYDEARLQEDLEAIMLALDDEQSLNRGYTPANVVSYHEQEQIEADLEAILLACDI